jgi:3-phenylpropionate/trans-cinnamate dioxygenase ferredoxin reductase subunit
VYYLRSLADALSIRRQLRPGCRLVVIGGGYVGLEVAASARMAGCEVTLFEMAPLVMSRQVDEEISTFFEERHRAEGVGIRCSSGVSAIEGSNQVEAVTVDGESLPADLVIIGVGVIPNTEWLAESGLLSDGALWVDANCRSHDPHIYGAGDVTTQLRANGLSMRLESVQNAVHQGKTAAAAILGQDPPPDAVPWFWSEQYDIKLQIAGLPAPGDETIVRRFDKGISTVYLNGNVVSAVSVVGNPREFMAAKKLIIKKCLVERDQIADPGVSLKELIT